MFAETIVFPQVREYTKRTTIIIFYMEENTMDKTIFVLLDFQDTMESPFASPETLRSVVFWLVFRRMLLMFTFMDGFSLFP